MTKDFEIMFTDLTPEAQKAFLEFEGIKDPKEGNYDAFPIDVLEREDEEEDDGESPPVNCVDCGTQLADDLRNDGYNRCWMCAADSASRANALEDDDDEEDAE